MLVVGSWDDWQYSLLMKKDPASGRFTCQANLKVGPWGRDSGDVPRFVHFTFLVELDLFDPFTHTFTS